MPKIRETRTVSESQYVTLSMVPCQNWSPETSTAAVIGPPPATHGPLNWNTTYISIPDRIWSPSSSSVCFLYTVSHNLWMVSLTTCSLFQALCAVFTIHPYAYRLPMVSRCMSNTYTCMYILVYSYTRSSILWSSSSMDSLFLSDPTRFLKVILGTEWIDDKPLQLLIIEFLRGLQQARNNFLSANF